MCSASLCTEGGREERSGKEVMLEAERGWRGQRSGIGEVVGVGQPDNGVAWGWDDPSL